MTIQYVQGSGIHSPTNWPSSYYISTFIRLDNALWFHSVAGEIIVLTKRKKTKQKHISEGNAVFIKSVLMPAVPQSGSSVSMYTGSGRLSNLLWWTWVCGVSLANDLWLAVSKPWMCTLAFLVPLFCKGLYGRWRVLILQKYAAKWGNLASFLHF